MTELLEYYNQKLVRARTPKTCCECTVTIEPGRDYHRCTGKLDGAWETYIRCLDCESMAREIDDLNNSQWDEIIPFGGLAEEIANKLDPHEWHGAAEFLQRRYGEVKP